MDLKDSGKIKSGGRDGEQAANAQSQAIGRGGPCECSLTAFADMLLAQSSEKLPHEGSICTDPERSGSGEGGPCSD